MSVVCFSDISQCVFGMNTKQIWTLYYFGVLDFWVFEFATVAAAQTLAVVWVRGNEASHLPQTLEHLVRDVTCTLWIESMANNPTCFLKDSCVYHTVAVCSRWHTLCSLFSMGKQWETDGECCLPPADTLCVLPFCRLQMTNRFFWKIYQNGGTYIYLSTCTPCSPPEKIHQWRASSSDWICNLGGKRLSANVSFSHRHRFQGGCRWYVPPNI